MSIRSVDLQVMLPRISEISRVQQVQLNENNLQRAETAAQMTQQSVIVETTVNKVPKDEAPLIRDREERAKKDEKENKKEGKREFRENMDKGNELKTSLQDYKGISIDIMA